MITTERIPPQSPEAEKAVLGALMLDRESMMDLSETLKAEDFYYPAHQEIFRVIRKLDQEGAPVDLLTVAEELKKEKSLEMTGGRAYLAELTASVVTTSNINRYSRIIEEKAMLRSLIHLSLELQEQGYDESRDPLDLLEKAVDEIFSLTQKNNRRDTVPIAEVLQENSRRFVELYGQKGKLRGVTTGFRALDRMTSGLQKSDLIIVGARPGMGKTAFSLNLAVNAAKSGKKVLIFNLEMKNTQQTERLISAESLVDFQKIRDADFDMDEGERINKAMARLEKLGIVFADTPGIDPFQIKNKCKKMKIKNGLDLVIIDYLQLIDLGREHSENRTQELTKLTRFLKLLARELECPLVVLSQLKRPPDKSRNTVPRLSDLRESGSIEQDADMVMLLHREDYETDNETTRLNECDIRIEKHRNGPTGIVTLSWMGKYQRFSDISFSEQHDPNNDGA